MNGCRWNLDPEARPQKLCDQIAGSQLVIENVPMPPGANAFPVCPEHAEAALAWVRETYGARNVREVGP